VVVEGGGLSLQWLGWSRFNRRRSQLLSSRRRRRSRALQHHTVTVITLSIQQG